MRLIDAVGVLELTYDGGLEGMPRGFDAWFDFYRAKAPRFPVVFGHWAARGRVDRPLCKGLDTGCVYGGRLTGLWWPRREWVSVPAHRAWFVRAGDHAAG